MLHRLVLLSLGAASGILGFAAGAAVTGSWLASGAIAVAIAVVVAWMSRRLVVEPDACPRSLKVVSAVATVVALFQLVRLSIFAVDSSRVEHSVVPSSQWEIQHSCLSAYFVAAQASSSNANIYDNALYSMPDDDPSQPRKPQKLGLFNVDVFEYPPPFLLLPRAIAFATPEFADMRMLWLALNGGLLLLAIVMVAGFLGPADGTRALLLSPLVWVAMPTLSALQKGNVQVLVIAISMLAMLLFERRRAAAGGALLAFATVSKLFPGLLLVYLIARRQWRAAAWTASFSIVFIVLTGFVLGLQPYRAFLDHLPGLVGGEAFPAFRRPAAMAINLSIPGLVFKLKLFGVPGMSFAAAKVVGWIYTLVAVAVTIFIARRTLRERDMPLAWLAVLVLATLRSPFLPQAYGALPCLWLLTLLAAVRPVSSRVLVATCVAWLGLSLYWPIDWPVDPRLLAVVMSIPLAVTVMLVVLVVRRAQQPIGETLTQGVSPAVA